MMDILATHAPMIGLLLFFAIFMGVVGWLLLPATRKQMQHNAQIPLMEDDHDNQ